MNDTPKPRIAYVVTSGEYSDYSIAGVFDNEATAEEYARNSLGQRWGRVEKFTLNSTTPQTVETWRCRLTSNGVEHIEKETTDDPVRETGYSSAFRRHGDGVFIAWGYSHRGPDVARKIAQDLLAQIQYEYHARGATSIPTTPEAK